MTFECKVYSWLKRGHNGGLVETVDRGLRYEASEIVRGIHEGMRQKYVAREFDKALAEWDLDYKMGYEYNKGMIEWGLEIQFDRLMKAWLRENFTSKGLSPYRYYLKKMSAGDRQWMEEICRIDEAERPIKAAKDRILQAMDVISQAGYGRVQAETITEKYKTYSRKNGWEVGTDTCTVYHCYASAT